MISSKQALKIIFEHIRPLGEEIADLSSILGRVLAQHVYSDVDIPPFDRSAMDGFAINSKDTSRIFEIIEDIPSGKVPKKKIGQGQCARIMTGAILPPGADKVVMVEKTRLVGKKQMEIIRGDEKSNISPRGEDVRKGERVLKKGTEIRPQEAAMMAACGQTKVKVLRAPRLAIISTGSELVEPQKKPARGRIRNTNSSMLLLQLKKLGLEGQYLGIARDDPKITEKLIRKGLIVADVLILTGGVSVGNYDFVATVLKKCGIKILFDKVAIKPGKPTTFGFKGEKYIFGLPGNPVSALITFELFVASALYKIMGKKTPSQFIKAILLDDFQRRDAEREQYFPVLINRQGALPLEFHGSGHMQALTLANGIMLIKRGIKRIPKGAEVDVRPI